MTPASHAARLNEIWGAENVVRFDASLVDPLGLPGEARQVLVDGGLPRVDEPIFQPEPPRLIEVPWRRGSLCRIGNDYGTAICVDTASGAVLSLSISGAHPDRFVNTTLPLFIDFMAAVAVERRELVGVDDEAGTRRVRQLREKLRLVDPTALVDSVDPDDADTFWSAYLWELERGLR